MSRFFVFLFVLSVVAFGSVSAREIYVHNLQGNDSFLGLIDKPHNTNGPVKTITRALQLAHSGDRVILLPSDEPYRESVTFTGQRNSCIPGYTFILDGNGAILDGSEPIPDAQWYPYGDGSGIFCFEPQFSAYQNLFKEGIPLERVALEKLRGVEDEPFDASLLKDMQWCLYNGVIYFRPQAGTLPEEHHLTMAGRKHGIALLHVRGVELKNLIVQGYQHDGIIASNAAKDVHLEKVVCRGNGRSGVCVGGACSVWLKQCVLGNNGTAQLLTEPLSQVSIFSSELLANTAPGWVDNGTITLPNGEKQEQSAVFLEGKRIVQPTNIPQPATPEVSKP